MINKIYNKNLMYLKKNDRLLYEVVENYDFEGINTENVRVDTALDDTKILSFLNNEYEWYFNSKYEPDKIAKQWVEKQGKIESTAVVMLFGLGNGLYLKKLIENTHKTVVFLIYEPSKELFYKALQEIDFSFLTGQVYIMVEGMNDSCFEIYFESFIKYTNLSVCKFLGHTNYFSCFQKESFHYLKRLRSELKFLDVNKNTSVWLAEGYYKNALMNLKWMDKVSIMQQIERKVGNSIPQNFPAIVVSAGPSLSKNIKELKKAKGRSFIIATDSALVGLLEEGIIPDAFASIEPIKELNRFEDPRIDNIPLLCPESARYEILLKHKDKKIFMLNKQGYGNYLYQKLGIDSTVMDGGGSVATFSYTVARIMGFKTIILIGQDLAFTDDTRYYDKIKDWSDHETLPDSMYVEVEDIYGGKVKTSRDLENYIGWFEKQIEDYEEIETIDATEGGAKIHGSIIKTLAATIEEKCKNEFDMTEFLRQVPVRLDYEERKKIFGLIKKIPSQYNKLYKDIMEGIELQDELMKLLEKREKDNQIIFELTKKIGKVMNKIENNPTYAHAQHKVKEVEYIAFNNLGISLEDNKEDAFLVIEKGQIMLKALKQILEKVVLQEVEEIVKDIKFDETIG